MGAESRFLALDDRAEWDAFGAEDPAAPAEWTSLIAVGGMRCAACALNIEAALGGVPGVMGSEVNATSGLARVRWSSDRVLPSVWLDAVRRAGYEPLPQAEADASGRRRGEQRRALWRVLVAGLCMMQVMMYAWPLYIAQPGEMDANQAQLLRWASWVLTLPVLLFCCPPFFRSALADLRQRRIGMDLPVALGMAITFAVSSAATFEPDGVLGQEIYFDSLTMFAFFLLAGRWLETRLRDRTAGALDALLNRLPQTVLRQRGSGGFERVAVRRLHLDDVLRVLPGEAFAADGVVLEGHTEVDEALLTGEAHPLHRAPGDGVIAGSHNLGAPVTVRVRQLGAQTRFAQIALLMQQAAVAKPRLARLTDRFAQPFLWAVLSAALLALLVWWPSAGAGPALMVATAVLIVTCPCALSLATPAAMLAAAGTLARGGVLVRRLAALEALAAVDTVLFDKTGTLTSDRMALAELRMRPDLAAADAFARAAALAAGSRHPVARALLAAAELSPDNAVLTPRWEAGQLREVTGNGMQALLSTDDRATSLSASSSSGVPHRLGSARFCGIDVPPAEPGRIALHLAEDGQWLATFEFVEQLRDDAATTVAQLRSAGLAVELVSGDRAAGVLRAAQAAGIITARGDCTPTDKLQRLQALQRGGRKVAMVGDGLNDGPVLAAADASFTLGNAVPLAQAQADFVLPG
ncbi:MAG: cation-translocating P-type ATPase, partial [Burkholderiaceae bacterium]